jgi:hypothetical protein
MFAFDGRINLWILRRFYQKYLNINTFSYMTILFRQCFLWQFILFVIIVIVILLFFLETFLKNGEVLTWEVRAAAVV